LVLIISLTAYVRTRDLPNLNGEFLLALDPHVFLRYARDIVEWGGVPLNDTMRYYPSGFDTSRELLMPSYATAAVYYFLNFFADVDIVNAAIIYPVIVTCIGMIFFFLFVRDIFGNTVAFSSSLLLAVVNGFLYRTSAGFTEKESVAVMFLFALIYFIIKALKNDDWHKKLFYSIPAGLCVIGSVLSWGGVNFTFIALGALFLVSIFLGISKRNDSIVFAVIVLSIISVTFLVGRYGNFVDIFKSYMFIYFPVALVLNLYRFELYPRIKKYIKKYKPKKLSEHFYSMIVGIGLLVLVSLVYPGFGFYSYLLNFAFERMSNPFGSDAFAMSVNENQAPYFYDPSGHVDWWSPMNFTFFTMILGSFILFFEMFKKFPKQKLIITSTYILTLILFIFSRFSTASEYAGITAFFGQSVLGVPLHYIILFAFAVYLAYFVVKNQEKFENFKSIRVDYLFMFFWFFVSAVGARGGVRIIFAVCPPAMILSGYFFKKFNKWIKGFVESGVFAAVITYSIFGVLFIYNLNIAIAANSNLYSSFTGEWDEAMIWVQGNTAVDSVFTHWWDYGYWVQTMGNRTTNLDGGNFDVNLDHMIGRYLFASQIYDNGFFNMTEPATVLAGTFGKPDYFLIIDDDVLKYVQMGRIGKRPTYYVPGYYYQEVDNSVNLVNATEYPTLLVFNSYYGAFPLQESFVYNNFIFQSGSTYIYNIIYPYNGTSPLMQPYGVIVNQYYPNQGEIIPFNCYCVKGEQCYWTRDDGIPACPLLFDDGILLITKNASDNLFTYLYLLDVKVPGFSLAYDNSRPLTIQGMLSQSLTDIKIYAINYTELSPFILDEPLKSYWEVPGGVFW